MNPARLRFLLRAVLPCVLTLGLPAAGGAQGNPRSPLPLDSLQPGHIVRIYAPGLIYGRRGRVEARVADTLLFYGTRHHELVRVPLARITVLQVAAPRPMSAQQVLRGAFLGAVVGLAAGGVASALADRDGSDCHDASGNPRCDFRPGRLLIGGSLGAMTGVGLTYFRSPDRWRSVRLPQAGG